jgi:superoxide dismutase, Fe-Mn family
LNHTLFWENLSPAAKQGGVGGEPPSGKLASEIEKKWGSFEAFKKAFNGSLAAIQGSGWSWLVKDGNGELQIVERANQDPVVGPLKPLLGVDAWEHAY